MRLTRREGHIWPVAWYVGPQYRWLRVGRAYLHAKHRSVAPLFSEREGLTPYRRLGAWRWRVDHDGIHVLDVR